MDILNSEFLFFLRCAQQNNLRYLLIGGYAVNYYGYTRNTDDMDIWLAPNNENKKAFIDTLLCMKYPAKDVAPLLDKDFTKYFMGSIGSKETKIDIITIVHYAISYDDAEKQKQVFEIEPDVFLNIVPYNILKDMKLRSRREKDLFDIARLEEILNKKK
ncbi:MAG: hypothetical protein ABR503_17070 [Chitinophagaceae bacterium]|jgi:hypothetical protein